LRKNLSHFQPPQTRECRIGREEKQEEKLTINYSQTKTRSLRFKLSQKTCHKKQNVQRQRKVVFSLPPKHFDEQKKRLKFKAHTHTHMKSLIIYDSTNDNRDKRDKEPRQRFKKKEQILIASLIKKFCCSNEGFPFFMMILPQKKRI